MFTESETEPKKTELREQRRSQGQARGLLTGSPSPEQPTKTRLKDDPAHPSLTDNGSAADEDPGRRGGPGDSPGSHTETRSIPGSSDSGGRARLLGEAASETGAGAAGCASRSAQGPQED